MCEANEEECFRVRHGCLEETCSRSVTEEEGAEETILYGEGGFRRLKLGPGPEGKEVSPAVCL